MIVEIMIFNFIFCSNDFTFSKENKCNYVHYWEKKLKSFHMEKKISIRYENFKFYAFVMFKMKYLINKMQCNIKSKQVWWLDVKVFYPHFINQWIKLHK